MTDTGGTRDPENTTGGQVETGIAAPITLGFTSGAAVGLIGCEALMRHPKIRLIIIIILILLAIISGIKVFGDSKKRKAGRKK
ncbi:MAG: hypothetical protein GY940_48015 [bacterium]|nr:hypothetical protein [bacterium]